MLTQTIVRSAPMTDTNAPLPAADRAIALIKDEHRALACVLGAMQAWISRVRDAGGDRNFELFDAMLRYIENVPDVVLDYHCDSPVDMERTSPSFFRGDLHGIATTTYQSGSHRPTPELGQYRVPGIERLYLVGPFQHPGGGVFGAGRATAMVMAGDLGIEFDQIRVS